MEEKNAIITSATIEIEDHGLLTAWLRLDYGGSGQGFGGYALYLPKSFAHAGAGPYAGHFIFRTLEICGVTKWSEVPGRPLRVKASHEKVHQIGHVIKDIWFDPSEEFRKIELYLKEPANG